jgi:hypothetical protein
MNARASFAEIRPRFLLLDLLPFSGEFLRVRDLRRRHPL